LIFLHTASGESRPCWEDHNKRRKRGGREKRSDLHRPSRHLYLPASWNEREKRKREREKRIVGVRNILPVTFINQSGSR